MCALTRHTTKKNIQFTKIILFLLHKYDSFIKNEITQNLFVQSRLLIFHLLNIVYNIQLPHGLHLPMYDISQRIYNQTISHDARKNVKP